ncbi:MazG nucleotide pyrophosphohydrolase domain-containing protein [Legionella drozanskii]|uniref:Nucleoside triphosphate pyrophosphohydrolase MazG n=1 Tax=Legionella drozanskii LLAP-1 TaxID=1212489 RepID=A0A0W0SR76_9GAMM|nr:MazG nucleotide pyrophosphohydrolase domain-containing protein [Legionella drozanskii]KTC85806.1 nucleoside triphosphate pyrophosphohydrolase MazG [Legionella drozanskii LLAP-1]
MAKQLNNPLHELIIIENDARNFGFDWPHEEMIIEQALSECDEIREAIANNEPSHRVQEEIGDLLHTAISLCLFAGFDPEQTLAKVAKKFGVRMEALKTIAKEQGLTSLKGQSTEFMIELWKKAKLANS